MKVTTFQTVASRFAKVVGGDMKCRVTFGGTRAYSTTGEVHLPALPAGTVMTSHEADVFRGYMDHEVGHQEHSDMVHFESFAKEFKKDPTLKMLWNVSEDVREELLHIEEYSGAARFLNTLSGFSDRDQISQMLSERGTTAPATYAEALTSATFRDIWSFRTPRDVGTDLTHAELGVPEIKVFIDAEFPKLASTQDAETFARVLRAMMKKAVEEFEPPDEGGDEKGSGKCDDASAGDGSPSDQPGDPGEGTPGDGAPGQRMTKPTKRGDLDDASDKLDDHDAANIVEKILQKIADRNAKLEGPTEPGTSATNSDDEGAATYQIWRGTEWLPPGGTHFDNIFVPQAKNKPLYESERADLQSEISASKRALTVFLRSYEQRAWSRGLEEGQIDDDRLADFCATGDQRIRKVRRERTFPNTAIHLMLDQSTSMDSKMVRQAAIVITEAFVALPKIKTCVAGFTTNNHSYNDDPGVGRLQGLDIRLFKDYDQTYAEAKERLGAIRKHGVTPLGEGYAYAFESLVVRPEKRKILILVTDGSPQYTCGGDASRHNDYVLMDRIKNKSARMGIETIGIDIRKSGRGGNSENSLSRFVRDSRRIFGVNELANALIELARTYVVPQR